MNITKKLWIYLATLLIASFATLLWTGGEIYRAAPPMPERVVSTDGEVIYTRADIELGRQVWQSMGGMQLGSIWGHGTYVAPDWSADWLHREAVGVLDLWAQREAGIASYAELPEEQRATFQARLETSIRDNTYDSTSETITLDGDRAAVIANVAAHYQSLFGNDPATAELREAYAMMNDTVPDAEHRRALTAFFLWTAWATVTEHPGSDITYTNNWPSEPLVGNKPPASLFLWSAFSVILLLAGIALLGWHHAVTAGRAEEPHEMPAVDPMSLVEVTPSMKAASKYFWVLLGMFLLQILLGTITAHYQVEGQVLYGVNLSEVLPYSLTRTWHTQLAVLWIATAWLATGLYMGPAISGYEPKYQRLGVNVLFTCLVIIIVGAFAGQWFAVMQMLGPGAQFLVRPSGMGIRRHRTLLAMVPVHRPDALACSGRPCPVACTAGQHGVTVARGIAVPVDRGDRPFLRSGAGVGRTQPHLGDRILALVAGASLGRGLLRGFRHRSARHPLHPPRPVARQARDGRGSVRHHLVPGGWCARNSAPSVFQRYADRGHRARRQLLGAGGGYRWPISVSRPTRDTGKATRHHGCRVIAGRSCFSWRSPSGTSSGRDYLAS